MSGCIGRIRGGDRAALMRDIAVICFNDVVDSAFHFDHKMLNNPLQCLVREDEMKVLLAKGLHDALVEPLISL